MTASSDSIQSRISPSSIRGTSRVVAVIVFSCIRLRVSEAERAQERAGVERAPQSTRPGRSGAVGEAQRWIRHALSEPQPGDEVVFEREVRDDQLTMIFVCCHPGLSRDAQTALTLKTVGGLSVDEIAAACLAQPTTIAQRLVRAKRRLRSEGVRFVLPSADALTQRLDAALEVFYLMFNEGYRASHGDHLVRHDLCREALRLALQVADHPVIGSTKVDALAALFHFQASRLATRVDADGDLLLLEEQDRSRWDRAMINRGALLLGRSGQGATLSTYHLQAEIAGCHALADSYDRTDWPRILECYDILETLHPSPVVAVNRLVALAKVHGPAAALDASHRLLAPPALEGYYPASVIRGELLSELGRHPEADACFAAASRQVASEPIRRYIERRRAALTRS